MSLKTDITGQEFVTNQGSCIKVIKYINNKKVLVEFQDKYRYQKWVQKDKILKGKVKNPYHPSVCGVGFHGLIENASRHPLYSKWANMLDRCYNPDSVAYKDYGAKGVYVSEDWHNFTNYVKDVSLMENFHTMLANPTEWHLDKDKSDSLLYSRNTCSIINRQENNELRTGDKEIIPVDKFSVLGEFIESYKSIADASRSLGFDKSNSHIRECCDNNTKTIDRVYTFYGYVWKYSTKEDK